MPASVKMKGCIVKKITSIYKLSGKTVSEAVTVTTSVSSVLNEYIKLGQKKGNEQYQI